MRRLAAVLFFVSAVLFPAEANAQSFDPRISVRLGSNQARSSISSLYPEIEVENRLYAFEEIKVTLDGSVFVGYWNAGGVKLFHCEDDSDRCWQNFAMGARLRVTPERLFIPVSFFGELSYHVVEEEIGFSRVPVDRQYGYRGVGGGARLDLPLVWGVHFVAQLQAHLPLRRYTPLRYSYGFGVSVPL